MSINIIQGRLDVNHCYTTLKEELVLCDNGSRLRNE